MITLSLSLWKEVIDSITIGCMPDVCNIQANIEIRLKSGHIGGEKNFTERNLFNIEGTRTAVINQEMKLVN